MKNSTVTAFRIRNDLAGLLKSRAEICGVSMSEYLQTVVDSFAGLTAEQFTAIEQRRNGLRRRVKDLLEECQALELEAEALEYDLDRLDGDVKNMKKVAEKRLTKTSA